MVTCGPKVNLLSIVTPNSLKVVTVLRMLVPREREGGGGGLGDSEKSMVTDLRGFMLTWFVVVHRWSASIVRWVGVWSGALMSIDAAIVQSST